jgi:hypothetical protein
MSIHYSSQYFYPRRLHLREIGYRTGRNTSRDYCQRMSRQHIPSPESCCMVSMSLVAKCSTTNQVVCSCHYKKATSKGQQLQVGIHSGDCLSRVLPEVNSDDCQLLNSCLVAKTGHKLASRRRAEWKTRAFTQFFVSGTWWESGISQWYYSNIPVASLQQTSYSKLLSIQSAESSVTSVSICALSLEVPAQGARTAL